MVVGARMKWKVRVAQEDGGEWREGTLWEKLDGRRLEYFEYIYIYDMIYNIYILVRVTPPRPAS